MWHNGNDPGSALNPYVIKVVSTAAFPCGLAVRVELDLGHVLLLSSGDARLVAGGLVDAAGEIERVAAR
jgi:hypothetical protein